MQDSWSQFIHTVTRWFRRRRFAQLLRDYPDLLDGTILDVGGSPHFWEKSGVDLAEHQITLLNIAVDGQTTDSQGKLSGTAIVLYDGHTIPWPDRHFDCVISNSVIEHVPLEHRKQFSQEIQRVGRGFIVQTPAWVFPIEPHFVAPFVHWLPRHLGRIVASFGLWARLQSKSKEEIDSYFNEVVLLRRKDFMQFFPDGQLSIERFMFIPKSYTLTRSPRREKVIPVERPEVDQANL